MLAKEQNPNKFKTHSGGRIKYTILISDYPFLAVKKGFNGYKYSQALTSCPVGGLGQSLSLKTMKESSSLLNLKLIVFLYFQMRIRKLQVDDVVKDYEDFQPDILMNIEVGTHREIAKRKTQQKISKKKPLMASLKSCPSEEVSLQEYSMRGMQSPKNVIEPTQGNFLTLHDGKKDIQNEETEVHREANFVERTIETDRRKSLMLKVRHMKDDSQREKKKRPSILSNMNHMNNVLKEQRKKNLTRNFIKKIHKKKINEQVYLEEMNFLQSERTLFDISGFQMNENLGNTIKILEIIFTFLLVFLHTIQLVYHNILEQPIFYLNICGAIFFIIEFVVSMGSVKKDEGKQYRNLNQIWRHIGPEKILIDLLNILVILIDSCFSFYAMTFVRLIISVKLPRVLQNLEEMEIKLITNNEKDKYWSLVKILLFNFCFAHILAIILSAMTQISPNQNWMTVRDIHRADWFEQYIWAYYWGTNIMLTVGFGDIAASNYKEAICLIFIETLSCIVLAYNVNCVGDLILNIKAKDHEKKGHIKLFRKITQNTPISSELHWKITNFIEESINLKKNFNYEEEYQFIANLPKYLKYDFLKETNKSVFNQLPFFQFTMEKTIYNLAEKIDMLMSHPEEIIRNKSDDFNLWILRSGEVGLTYERRGSDMNGEIMDKIVVKGNQQPFLLSLNFITKNQLNYEMKSLQYSSLYFLQFQKLIQALKENYPDFLYYAFMRDKIKNIPDEFEVYKCSMCGDRFHYKFDCPLIHYIPNRDKIIYKNLRQVNFCKNKDRIPMQRSGVSHRPFEVFKYFKVEREETIKTDLKFSRRSSILVDMTHFDQNLSSLAMDEENETERNMKMEGLGMGGIDGSESIDGFKQLKDFISGEFQKMVAPRDEIEPIWMVNSDVMMDFPSYFQADNPRNIGAKIEAIKKTRLNQSKERVTKQ